jgi:hypothetical protein
MKNPRVIVNTLPYGSKVKVAVTFEMDEFGNYPVEDILSQFVDMLALDNGLRKFRAKVDRISTTVVEMDR